MGRRRETEGEERHYVLRAVEGRSSGIGTIIDDQGGFVLAVMSGDRFKWTASYEPRLDEGATVDLLGPMTEQQAQSTIDAMTVEKEAARKQRSLQVATEAREIAALIVGPHEPVAEHLSCEQHDQRIEALALVIYQARGYSQATELPA